MMYAQVLVDLQVECDTFLALWSSKRRTARLKAFANNDCEACLPQDKELRFYINMDMMGISWPAVKENGDPFPYHAWSGPDIDPEVQDVAITSVLTTSIATSSRRPWTFESKAVMERLRPTLG